MNEVRRESLAGAVSCIVAAYDEELTIVRGERDTARAAAKQAVSEALHWKSNHADQVARCALLRERPDLPVDRIPAYKELTRLQGEVTALQGTLAALIEDRDTWRRYAKRLEQEPQA